MTSVLLNGGNEKPWMFETVFVALDDVSVTEWRDMYTVDDKPYLQIVALDDVSVTEWRSFAQAVREWVQLVALDDVSVTVSR